MSSSQWETLSQNLRKNTQGYHLTSSHVCTLMCAHRWDRREGEGGRRRNAVSSLTWSQRAHMLWRPRVEGTLPHPQPSKDKSCCPLTAGVPRGCGRAGLLQQQFFDTKMALQGAGCSSHKLLVLDSVFFPEPEHGLYHPMTPSWAHLSQKVYCSNLTLTLLSPSTHLFFYIGTVWEICMSIESYLSALQNTAGCSLPAFPVVYSFNSNWGL